MGKIKLLRVETRACPIAGDSPGKQLSCLLGLGGRDLLRSSWEVADWVLERHSCQCPQETLLRHLASRTVESLVEEAVPPPWTMLGAWEAPWDLLYNFMWPLLGGGEEGRVSVIEPWQWW